MEVRQRKLRTHNDAGQRREASSRTKKTRRSYVAPVLVLGALFLGYIAISYDLKPVRLGKSALANLAYSLNLYKPFYVVVIDAGSTGSRLLAFTFHTSLLNGNLILDHELYTDTKPGLSAFADNPAAAAESLARLMDKAKAVIPKSEWSNTPISMRATAGLRMLPTDKASAILSECASLLDESGFLVSKDSVAILDGRDEGIFAWFTVNFLFERFSEKASDGTVAALDLGGGSNQVTLAPEENDINNEKHIYAINAFGQNMSIYTCSYEGFGLMAARKAILTAGMNLKEHKKDEKITVNSECINPIINKEWNYGGRTYIVKGPLNPSHKITKTQNFGGTDVEKPVVRFNECRNIVKNYVNSMENKPKGLSAHEVYAFSYYFDRATEVGLIDPITGGTSTVKAFYDAAVSTCDYPNTEQPFMCLDLMFISVLLQEGFGLEPKTPLFLYRKYNGHELSWALGAAFSQLEKAPTLFSNKLRG